MDLKIANDLKNRENIGVYLENLVIEKKLTLHKIEKQNYKFEIENACKMNEVIREFDKN